jgi:carboxyl-terminal processing protease
MKHTEKSFLIGLMLGSVAVMIIVLLYTSIIGVLGLDANTPQKKLREIQGVLTDNYVSEFEEDKLIEAMYSGYVSGVGDRYTSYMDKDTLESFLQHTEGTYAGIGCVVTPDDKDNTIKVLLPYDNSPSKKAGIVAGDKIVKVNGVSVFGDNYEDAISMMKGRPGTSVKLTLLREDTGDTFELDIVREQIDIPTVSHKVIDGDIGYIMIANFERVTYAQFLEAYEDLLTLQKVRGLIIDVRNNPGGLLKTVTDITDLLVPDGYIVYTEDKNGTKEYIYSDANRIEIPLAVLVNGNSASASEVLSGAVKDMGAGVLVGAKTFGKGLVQNLFKLSDGSAIKVTIAKYYTPNGVCINGEGIQPDYAVSMDDELTYRIASLEPQEDPQLMKAVEVINTLAEGY